MLRRSGIRRALACGLACAAAPLAAAEDLIAVNYTGSVYRVDSATGAGTLIGSSGFGQLNSLAVTPDGTVYVGRSPSSSAFPPVLRIDPQTGAGSAVAFPGALDIRALAALPDGRLLAVLDHASTGSNKDELWLLDPATLATSLVGSTGRTAIQAMTRAADGTLYAWEVGNAGLGLIRIDPVTGAATDVNPAVASLVNLQFLAFLSDGTLVGGNDGLYTVDVTTGSATLIGSGGYVDLRGADSLQQGPSCGLVYGQGCPGSGGITPSIDPIGCPAAGGAVQVAVSQALGGAGGVLFVGLNQAALPMAGPCTLNVAPVLPLIVPFPLSGAGPGNGSIVLVGSLPPQTAGLTFTLQAFVSDPAPLYGFAATQGLQLNVQ